MQTCNLLHIALATIILMREAKVQTMLKKKENFQIKINPQNFWTYKSKRWNYWAI